jgi:hypothetical protein
VRRSASCDPPQRQWSQKSPACAACTIWNCDASVGTGTPSAPVAGSSGKISVSFSSVNHSDVPS